ncbi:MAG: radical SAM protein [Minicystis sp.]
MTLSAPPRLRVLANAARFATNYLRGEFDLEPAAPAALLIGITNRCNLRCDFCFHADNDIPSVDRRAKGLMPFERFASIVEQARGYCTHLEFGLFGEPALHPRFVDMVRLAADAGLTVAIYTNGVLLNPPRGRELILAGPASVTFSMEGDTVAEYERLRVGARWDRVSRNLRAMLDARRELGRRNPRMIVRGIALQGTSRAPHSRLYESLGVDQVMYVPATNWSGSLRAPQDSVRVTPPPARTELCTFPWLQLGIDWDGTVVPCCVDFNAKNRLGNIDESPIRDIWHGEALSALRRALRTRDRQTICAQTGCAGCSQLGQPALPLDKKAQLVRMALGELAGRFADGR